MSGRREERYEVEQSDESLFAIAVRQAGVGVYALDDQKRSLYQLPGWAEELEVVQGAGGELVLWFRGSDVVEGVLESATVSFASGTWDVVIGGVAVTCRVRTPRGVALGDRVVAREISGVYWLEPA